MAPTIGIYYNMFYNQNVQESNQLIRNIHEYNNPKIDKEGIPKFHGRIN